MDDAIRIVEALFPRGKQQEQNWRTPNFVWNPNDEITDQEIIKALKKANKGKKAPGPDGITANIWLRTYGLIPLTIKKTLNACLKEDIFPADWKKAHLVLIKKSKKTEEAEPSSYRPICLIDEIAKTLERIIDFRLATRIKAQGGISTRQFGFLPQKTTMDAILRVKDIVTKAKTHHRLCALLGLDISNAFNTLDWNSIIRALDRFELSTYLHSMVRSYLSDRQIRYDLSNGQTYSTVVDRGVHQGSALGPKLWIVAYDGVLRLSVPKGIRLIAFANDLIVTIQGENREEMQERAALATKIVENKKKALGLSIATQKTELLMCASGNKELERVELDILGTRVLSVPTMKYLGILLDPKWEYGQHLGMIADRAKKRETHSQDSCPTLRAREKEIESYICCSTSLHVDVRGPSMAT